MTPGYNYDMALLITLIAAIPILLGLALFYMEEYRKYGFISVIVGCILLTLGVFVPDIFSILFK